MEQERITVVGLLETLVHDSTGTLQDFSRAIQTVGMTGYGSLYCRKK